MRESRTIKFRAWDKLEGMMVPHENLMQQQYGYPERDNIFNDPTHILMQFTGLHDKNGKEIYEGDVIRFRNFAGSMMIDAVIWNNKESAFTIRSGIYFARYDVLEVIGNIYEHPVLLTATAPEGK